ncbi:MAG: PAS domain S-box protein, partial [Deltaproteobacteria bacterium]|nr:PAS domain S-box protein [Deltaproteobacteria bacterium]
MWPASFPQGTRMEDKDKTKKQLLDELNIMRHRVAELEALATERDQAGNTLREREERYHAIVRAFDGIIYICSEDNRIEFMNDLLIQRTGHDATGELCYQVLHDRDSICPWCLNEQVLKGETVRWEVQSPKDNRWYYVVNTPIYNADGTVSKQAMILDITDRKEMEEALEKSAEKIKLFAYSVSHDLKSPAAAIYGLAKRLLERYRESLDEKGRRYCDQILKASLHVAAPTEKINAYIEA